MAQKTYTVDGGMLVSNGEGAITTSAAAQVAGSAKVLDLGAGFFEADLVVDVTAIDTVTGDEKYELEFQLSSSSTFASDVNVGTVLKIGGATATGASAANAIGRYVIGVSNLLNGTLYRYARLYRRIAGTTPSLTSSAFLGKPLATQ